MKALIALTLLAAAAFAAEPKVVPVWPGAAPGSENWTWQEQEIAGPQDKIRRTYNVTRPTLTVYLPDAPAANRPAVIICPGGAFRLLSIDFEGHDVARWLNSFGVAAMVLKYRLARTGDDAAKDPATQAERRKTTIPLAVADGLEAIRVVRAHAAEWGLAPNRIGILGFSAGGYVTAAAALQYDAKSRPDFAVPIYPAVPEEVNVPADAPPLFLLHADDDKTVSPVNNTIRLYSAWKKAGLSAELHIYSRGGHGFGMLKKDLPVDTWPDRLRDWMVASGFVSAR